MTEKMKRVAVLTGGGDAPGLNGVIAVLYGPQNGFMTPGCMAF